MKTFLFLFLMLTMSVIGCCSYNAFVVSKSKSDSVTGTTGPSYEAEASSNTNNGTKTFSCNLCSGGVRVGWISFTISLQFNNINVDHSGNYTLKVYYINSIPNRVTTAFISVDGGPNMEVPGLRILTVNCCDNIAPQLAQMTVSLQAGSNTIKI